ncbi:hypothetical protein [Nonomuraea rhizosphaerae]|uniref:hypothetical protein n=1 Tax=Nonomuraea rhizosphaerae TaxID=2665663 RepID=UPI001C5F7744|nr:hypothetical protein [Nonomuraea rhizosphaerae]
MEINHKQLREKAAPAFDEAAEAVRKAVDRAEDALRPLNDWPTGEDVDKAFVEWFRPKRNEMIKLIGEFAGVYNDIADGLDSMQRNVAKVDWGIADDLKIKDVPVYKWPDE